MKPEKRGWGEGQERVWKAGLRRRCKPPANKAPFSQLPTLPTSASSSLQLPRLLILTAPNPGPGVNWLRLH